jgi:hypothetical protein
VDPRPPQAAVSGAAAPLCRVGDYWRAGDSGRHAGLLGAVQPVPVAGTMRLHRADAALHALKRNILSMAVHRLITLGDYLATSQENLEKGLEQNPQLVAHFERLNVLYHEGGDSIVVPREGPPFWIAALVHFTHQQLHFTMASFLRTHRGDALASVRRGVDATLNGLVLEREPKWFGAFRASAPPFTRITSYLSKATDRYPEAQALVDLHRTCSKYASHADFSVLPPLLKVGSVSNSGAVRGLVKWFHPHQDDPELDHAYGVDLLFAFGLMLRTWSPWVTANSPNLGADWGAQVQTEYTETAKEQQQIYDAFRKSGRLPPGES